MARTKSPLTYIPLHKVLRRHYKTNRLFYIKGKQKKKFNAPDVIIVIKRPLLVHYLINLHCKDNQLIDMYVVHREDQREGRVRTADWIRMITGKSRKRPIAGPGGIPRIPSLQTADMPQGKRKRLTKKDLFLDEVFNYLADNGKKILMELSAEEL